MQYFRLLFALGIASCVVACDSDSNSPPTRDSGVLPEGDVGGKPGSGGSTGKAGGVTGNTGGTTPGGGGTSPGTGGGNGAGGKASGGAPASGGSNAGNPNASTPGGSTGSGGATTGTPDAAPGDGGLHIEHVFVIAMENHDESQIIGDVQDAPYINNTLVKGWASTSNFTDTLPLAIPSEPHYLLLEAGTNAFTDVTFTGDGEPSAGNSTASTAHLVTQMKNATPPVTWMSYQEGLDSTSGDCPIHTSGYYMPKHDPFIFFQDVAGSPPSATNAYCAAHHAPLSQLAADLTNGYVAGYVFITPNQCNDMHGQSGCPNSNTIRAGDDWLSQNLPPLVKYSNANRGVIFIVWDEGVSTLNIPFIAIGPSVKKGYVGKVTYTHASVVKSVERIFGLPYLDTVKNATDLSDLFEGGRFP